MKLSQILAIIPLITACGDETKKSKKEHDSSNTDLSGALNDYACGGGNAAGKWLGQDDVAAALHVKTGTKGMKYNWGPYKVSGDLRPLYKELAQKYRMLIYSGDVDACVPYWGTEEWTRELGFKVKTDWHPWMAEHLNRPGMLRAGYAIEYEYYDPRGLNPSLETKNISGLNLEKTIQLKNLMDSARFPSKIWN